MNYIKEHEGQWIRKGALYGIAEDAGFSPETGARKLREATEEGLLAVSYYEGQKGQKLARYAYNPPKELKRIIRIIDGRAVEQYV